MVYGDGMGAMITGTELIGLLLFQTLQSSNLEHRGPFFYETEDRDQRPSSFAKSKLFNLMKADGILK
jgi:hypothetical protein